MLWVLPILCWTSPDLFACDLMISWQYVFSIYTVASSHVRPQPEMPISIAIVLKYCYNSGSVYVLLCGAVLIHKSRNLIFLYSVISRLQASTLCYCIYKCLYQSNCKTDLNRIWYKHRRIFFKNFWYMNFHLQQSIIVRVKVRYVFSLHYVTDLPKPIIRFIHISTVFSKKLGVEMPSNLLQDNVKCIK